MYYYSQAIKLLIDNFSELKEIYDDDEDYYIDLPYIFYESEFVPFIEKEIKENNINKLSSIFNFIEDLYINGDEKLKNLIGVSVIEALCLEPDFNYNMVHPYIGKVTKKEFDRMLNR
ncbi:DUF7674 family protein [Lactococcus lactis]|uniref:DUF7674 family protein n=1 Tax=Lactococcus lactis TaxID=1358 RepID=UPI0020673659|nr:hypothetical protein [Lactococcus lactis]BDH84662.1 hypothetical protein LLID5_19470 [Lactococcus lactis]